MPRTIASTIGGRTLTIEDTKDNFQVSAFSLPDGSLGMEAALGDNYAHDRAADVPYHVTPGVAHTQVWWVRGTQGNDPWRFGVKQQNVGTIGAGNSQWYHYTSGNNARLAFALASAQWQTITLAPLGASNAWGMEGFAYDPNIGSFGAIKPIYNGTYTSSFNGTNPNPVNLTQPLRSLTTPELSIGGYWNYALSVGTAGLGGFAIAKMASIPNKVLTDTELADLYLAMAP